MLILILLFEEELGLHFALLHHPGMSLGIKKLLSERFALQFTNQCFDIFSQKVDLSLDETGTYSFCFQ